MMHRVLPTIEKLSKVPTKCFNRVPATAAENCYFELFYINDMSAA